jgi:hypothetical protein
MPGKGDNHGLHDCFEMPTACLISCRRMRKNLLACVFALIAWAIAFVQGYLHFPSTQLEQAAKRLSAHRKAPEKRITTKWDTMDIGPFFSSTLSNGPTLIPKAISVRLGTTNEAAICFDTELLRVGAGWVGGFLKFSPGFIGLEEPPKPNGPRMFSNPAHPGWSSNGSFSDPREKFGGKPNGNLPATLGRYKGLYVHGEKVIFNYTIGSSEILDMPGFERQSGLPCFTRTIEISNSDTLLSLQVCGPLMNATEFLADSKSAMMKADYGRATFVLAHITGDHRRASWTSDKGHGIRLHLQPHSEPTTFKIHLYFGDESYLKQLRQTLRQNTEPTRLTELCRPAQSLNHEALPSPGVMGEQKGAFQVDTLPVPQQNPWKSWIRPTGIDFFTDGRAALCSLSGDVWIISGLDNKLDRITWNRFATGLHQPLGLKVVRDTIFITGRDQITRLHDRNNDGTADFYENFNNDVACGLHFLEFCLGLDTDSTGNFYFTKASDLNVATHPHHGTVLKVTSDGKKLEVVATGFRTPNGICVSGADEIMVTDNQGPWIPTSKINLVRRGGFYGNTFTALTKESPAYFDPPLCWIPHSADNSSADPIYARTDLWGPFNKSLFYLSYGTCSIFHVMTDNPHGAVVKLPLKFNAGLLRGRFNPRDGQMYICALSGWQTSGLQEAALYRVRYTGKPANIPMEFRAGEKSLRLTFSDPLENASACDPQNYSIQAWNYDWKHDYHSEPVGRNNLEITRARLLPDERTVEFDLPKLTPTMQLEIRYDLDARDGSRVRGEVYATINEPNPSPSTQAHANSTE